MAHALILGASGISGWGILNQISTYPNATYFTRITGTTNRPLSLKKARITADSRIKLVSGIDFTKPVEEVAELLKNTVPSAESVSHVFFTGMKFQQSQLITLFHSLCLTVVAYVHKDDQKELKEVNNVLIRTSIMAIELVSKHLKVVVLQTGGKG